MLTYYQNYDVLAQMEHWDENTRRAINKRLEATSNFKFFTDNEGKIVLAYLEALLAEDRKELLVLVLAMLDSSLGENDINNYRKKGIPDVQKVFRCGLQGLDQMAQNLFQKQFTTLSIKEREKIITDLAQGSYQGEAWEEVSCTSFFDKSLTMATDAFYSLPAIWSEIGYGGPAYPRGYVRTQLGGWDPWEAKRNE